jgi:hypothetical protein
MVPAMETLYVILLYFLIGTGFIWYYFQIQSDNQAIRDFDQEIEDKFAPRFYQLIDTHGENIRGSDAQEVRRQLTNLQIAIRSEWEKEGAPEPRVNNYGNKVYTTFLDERIEDFLSRNVHPPLTCGYVYILTNISWPNLVGIGWNRFSPELGACQSSFNLPFSTPNEVDGFVISEDWQQLAQNAEDSLAQYEVSQISPTAKRYELPAGVALQLVKDLNNSE